MYVEYGVSVYVVIIIVRWNANIKNYILDVGHGPRVLVVWRRRRRRRLIIVIAVREQFWRRWLRAVLDQNRLDCGSSASTGRGFVGGHWVAVIAQPRGVDSPPAPSRVCGVRLRNLAQFGGQLIRQRSQSAFSCSTLPLAGEFRLV